MPPQKEIADRLSKVSGKEWPIPSPPQRDGWVGLNRGLSGTTARDHPDPGTVDEFMADLIKHDEEHLRYLYEETSIR